MFPILSPKLDYTFKKLFANNPELLIDLINSVLMLKRRSRIDSIIVNNPNILPEHISEKYIILDINAIDDQGKQYDIEMQVNKYDFYPKRSLYYLTRMYASQLFKGEKYNLLEPVLGIHFLDYVEYPAYPDKFHFCFEFREKTYPQIQYSDDLTLHIFEMPKALKQKKFSDKSEQKQYEWLKLFNTIHEGGDIMRLKLIYSNPIIHRAIDRLYELSEDEQTRQEAEFREKALKNKVSELGNAEERGIKRGIKQGVKQGVKRGVKRGVKQGFKMGTLNAIELGLKTKFGNDGLTDIIPKIKGIDNIDLLVTLQNGLYTVASLNEFYNLYQEGLKKWRIK